MPDLITFPLAPSRPFSRIIFSRDFLRPFGNASHDSKLCGSPASLLSRSPGRTGRIIWNYKSRRRRRDITRVNANRSESPYDVLGVSSDASLKDIKRAYRKLALKFHPDVNRESNAEEKFKRIKQAYNTLSSPESRRKYDSHRASGYSSSGGQWNPRIKKEEEESFYGFGDILRDVQIAIGSLVANVVNDTGDFFKDLQEDMRSWETSSSGQGKPKSLWEELADIGEELVEFLEQELKINDSAEEDKAKPSKKEDENDIYSNIEENIDEIEATLAKLKRELGI